jgi:hypothetical protein
LILLWCLNFQFPFLSNCFLSFSWNLCERLIHSFLICSYWMG